MRLAVISFTRAGARWCSRLTRHFRESGDACEGYIQPRFFAEAGAGQPGINLMAESVGEWTGRQFLQADGLIYIGAVGIAVRAIAPFLNDKLTDPAVVVMDEAGHYVISLLSGHVGGANELTKTVANVCGAQPVITTATDVNEKKAADVWAAERGWQIGDREQAKQVAASLLEEKPVGFFSDFPLLEPLPAGYFYGQAGERNLWLTVRTQPDPGEELLKKLITERRLLRLLPRILIVGVGCRKGMKKERIEEMIERILREAKLDWRAVSCLASIDRKKEEEGICWLARKWAVPFLTFSAEQLEQIQESVEESAFVRQVTGTGNVCERAALAGAGVGGRLVVRKRAENGVTVAVAQAEWDRQYGRRGVE